jgi:hypothetical protein
METPNQKNGKHPKNAPEFNRGGHAVEQAGGRFRPNSQFQGKHTIIVVARGLSSFWQEKLGRNQLAEITHLRTTMPGRLRIRGGMANSGNGQPAKSRLCVECVSPTVTM